MFSQSCASTLGLLVIGMPLIAAAAFGVENFRVGTRAEIRPSNRE
jgi:hypothetical protein